MLTWHDVFNYLKILLRWWFVLALAVTIAASVAWNTMRQQPDMYVSQVTLSVGNNFSATAPSEAQVTLSNVLANYYATLAKREVILAPVIEELQLSFPWQVIRDRMLSANVNRVANLLEIRITDTNPDRAAAVANAVAASLIAFTPNSQEDVEAQQSEISRQMREIQGNLEVVESRIAELQARLGTVSSAIDIADLQNQIQVLQTTRTQYLDNYNKLVGLSNQTLTNSLSIFEAATPASYPLPKKVTVAMGIAGAGGLVLAIVAVLMIDMLDERWRTGGELQSRTGIKSLGEVPDVPSTVAVPAALAHRREQAIRAAYANLVLAARSRLPRSLLVSSPQYAASRSAVAIDLAGMYARTGHRVILVDAENGPSSLLDQLDLVDKQAEQSGWGRPRNGHGGYGDGPTRLLAHLRPTALHNVLVLSAREAGFDRFSVLVPLAHWSEMVAHLQKVADVVIFDGPSALHGPEAGILAPLVEGALLVLNGRQDSRSSVIKARNYLGGDLGNQFLGAIVVGQAPGAASQRKASPPRLETGGSLRFVVSRRGITISMGARADEAPSASDVGPASAAPRLLPLPDAGAQAPDDTSATLEPDHREPITWEDLVQMEQSAPSAGPAAHRASKAEPEPAMIITPPPAAGRAATSHRRRPRIANSQRAQRGQVGRTRREEMIE